MLDDFMKSNEAQLCFHQAFITLLNKSLPICHLNQLPHWRSKEKSISSVNTFFMNGYFYNFFTKIPDKTTLETKIAFLKDCKYADQLMLPSVRNDDSLLLKELKFKAHNHDKEAIFHFDNDVDLTLRNTIGGHRLREIKRVHRKSFTDYSFEWVLAHNITNELLDEFEDIDIQHIIRHQSVQRIYTKKVNHSFATSNISSNFRWFIRRNLSTGELVQVGLVLLGSSQGTIYYLNQSIDRDSCNKSHNLYIAAFYELYKFAESMGYTSVHMGRGLEQIKINLGVNKIIDQASWIIKL